MEWRYIPPFSATGSIQMAVDTWLFEQCHSQKQPPCLRFYSWFPMTLSLGYFQKHWPDHWNRLVWQGTPLSLVRRPSGGRGVLHHGDLTYSLVTPMSGYSRTEAYRQLCQFLIEGWQRLGTTLAFGETGRGYHKEVNCFRLATGADLVDSEGHKLIGSAQLWRGDTVLQHGSMALHPNSSLNQLVFGSRPQTRAVPPHSVPAHSTKPPIKDLPLMSVIESLTQSAREVLDISLILAPLSMQEWEEVSHYVERTQV